MILGKSEYLSCDREKQRSAIAKVLSARRIFGNAGVTRARARDKSWQRARPIFNLYSHLLLTESRLRHLMSASGESRKRSRLDGDAESLTAPSHAPDICRGDPWLEDGNIVLQAENTRFRVLKSLLMSSSDVFRDMFSLSSLQAAEIEDGCPVIQLHDDPVDVSRTLKAIYYHSYDR